MTMNWNLGWALLKKIYPICQRHTKVSDTSSKCKLLNFHHYKAHNISVITRNNRGHLDVEDWKHIEVGIHVNRSMLGYANACTCRE